MEKRRVCYGTICIDSKWLLAAVCVLLYISICLVSGSLQLSVALGIFLLGFVGWSIILNEFLSAGKEKRKKYLRFLISARPGTFNVMLPFLESLDKKNKK